MAARTAQVPGTEPVTPRVGGLPLLDATPPATAALTALLLSAGAGGLWPIAVTLATLGAACLVVLPLRRVSPRRSGLVLTGLGIAAVAVGVGFVPYLVKPAPVGMKAGAAALLALSLVLLVGGAARASRGRSAWRRSLAAVAVAAVTLLAVSVVAPAVAATHVPRPALGATPADVGLVADDVRLRTADGVTLAAWYVPSQNGAAVVLLHGAGSTRSNVLDQAVVLAGAGFGVLMPDARGHGQSEGRAMDFGWAGDLDVAAATEFLTSRPDVNAGRIGLVGMSMGGEEAIGAAGPGVAAVVAEGATARVASDEAWLSDRYGFRGTVQEQLEKVQDLVTAVLTDVSRPPSLHDTVTGASDTEFLLITGGEVPDEADAAAYIASAAPARVQVWTIDGAGHTGGLATMPDEWESRVTGFLTDQLAGPDQG